MMNTHDILEFIECNFSHYKNMFHESWHQSVRLALADTRYFIQQEKFPLKNNLKQEDRDLCTFWKIKPDSFEGRNLKKRGRIQIPRGFYFPQLEKSLKKKIAVSDLEELESPPRKTSAISMKPKVNIISGQEPKQKNKDRTKWYRTAI